MTDGKKPTRQENFARMEAQRKAPYERRMAPIRARTAELDAAAAARPPAPKSFSITLILWVFLGIFGAHRFYLGYWKSGLLWLFTLGFVGVGWVIDAFRLAFLYDRRMGGDFRA